MSRTEKLPSTPLRRWAIGLSLVALLVAVYMLTYNGYAYSRDEWFLFDATESVARRGTLELNYEFDAFPPLSLAEARPPNVDAEPLQPVLAAPLFLLAQALPAIGLVQAVWTFNVLITALTAGVLYAYGLALGYRARVAAAVALTYGLGTIAWPYSRTFFREPLFALLALLSAYWLRQVRARLAAGTRPFKTALAFVATFAAMLLAKEAALLLLPALALEAVPALGERVRLRRRTVTALLVLALVSAALVLTVLNLDTWFGLEVRRWNISGRLHGARDNLATVSTGIKGYLFSPARSVWLFSPVLLLGLAAWPQLVRARRWRLWAVPLAVLVAFVVGYAAGRGEAQWYGGTGWGARYLVPTVPFLALWLLPVYEALLRTGAAWWRRVGALAVFALSFGVQLLAAAVPVNAYYAYLAAQNPPVVPWEEGAWAWRWSPLWVNLKLLGAQTPHWAWRQASGADVWLLPALSAALGTLALGWLVWWVRHRQAPRLAFPATLGALALALGAAWYGGLYAVREDPRFLGDFQPAQDLLAQLEAQLTPDDVIVLSDDTYAEFFMNAYKRSAPTVYTLPFSPGERPSPEQTPQVVSAYPEELIHRSDTLVFAALAQQHRRLWLVVHDSPFVPWAVRPVELYLSRHYFPVRDVQGSDVARAVLFDMTDAPPATARAWPAQRLDVDFGGMLRLVGYDLPRGVTYRAGETVPVSLLWETRTPPAQDYTVGLLLIGPDGQPVAQRDALPINQFGHTSTWRVGALQRDNHALELPPNLPAGDYALWVVLYWWQAPAERLAVADADGQALGDHALLGTLHVQP